MQVLQTYTFSPGVAGAGTISVPGSYNLESFGEITNVTRGMVLYKPDNYKAGVTLSVAGGNTVLTFEQDTLFCKSTDDVQILVYEGSGGVVDVVEVSNLPALVDGNLPVRVQQKALVPTTTSIASSASSQLLLASNVNRKGYTIANSSTETLYLSFTTPATVANSFLLLPPRAVVQNDQFLIVSNAIYGIWTAANGTAQVTEYV